MGWGMGMTPRQYGACVDSDKIHFWGGGAALISGTMGQESGKRPKFDLDPKALPKTPEAVQDEHLAFNTVVGESIRRARQEHGWTQAFLADQAALSPNYIARLERGELGPSLFVANRICEALGIAIEELVGPRDQGGAGRKTTMKKRAAG